MTVNNNINYDFPEVLPVFPLEGVVMFPDTYLPLNIFEPRYLEMINKAVQKYLMGDMYLETLPPL